MMTNGQTGTQQNLISALWRETCREFMIGLCDPHFSHFIATKVTSFVIFSCPRITVTITFSPS